MTSGDFKGPWEKEEVDASVEYEAKWGMWQCTLLDSEGNALAKSLRSATIQDAIMSATKALARGEDNRMLITWDFKITALRPKT